MSRFALPHQLVGLLVSVCSSDVEATEGGNAMVIAPATRPSFSVGAAGLRKSSEDAVLEAELAAAAAVVQNDRRTQISAATYGLHETNDVDRDRKSR